MVSVETISIVFTGLSVSLAAFYYIMTLRNTQKNQQMQLETRQAQLFMQVYDRWQGSDYWKYWADLRTREWKDYDDFQEKYGMTTNPDAFSRGAAVFAFYEGLGVLVKRGLIDPAMVDDLLGGALIMYWEQLGDYYKEMRVRIDYPQVGAMIEYLYDVIKPIAEEENIALRQEQVT